MAGELLNCVFGVLWCCVGIGVLFCGIRLCVCLWSRCVWLMVCVVVVLIS